MAESPSGAMCPGTQYIWHALSLGMFDACQACGERAEEGLVRASSPNKAFLELPQNGHDQEAPHA